MSARTPFTDETPMPFGKHKGTKLANVPAQYLLWLYNEGKLDRGVDAKRLYIYIRDNMDALKKEAPNAI